MKNLMEKSLVHLLNGDEEKAIALFHQYMVEKAKKIHEAVRQDDMDLDENWDNEIHEEEYFDDSEVSDDAEPTDFDVDVTSSDDSGDVSDDMPVDDDADVSDDFDGEVEDMNADAPASKDEIIDELEDKVGDFMDVFDRLMAELKDEDGDVVDDDTVDEEEPEMDSEESDDLVDQFDDDISDDDKPESKTMESEDMDDEDLADITESVMSELEKISMPPNTDGRLMGGSEKVPSPNHKSNLPVHGVEDRIDQAKPYLVKGGNNDSFERETAPPVKGPDTVVKGIRPTNSRKSFKDEMKNVPKDGDSSAKLNSNFAGSEDKGSSPVDGKMKRK